MSRSYKRATRINSANIKSFANRLAVEIDAMRGKIFDHIRSDNNVIWNTDEGAVRAEALGKANTALYRAHVALLEAQAELMK